MPTGLIILVAILAWPFVEIATFIAVGREIGILPTLVAVVATSVMGGLLLRAQGLAALKSIKREVRHGELPADAIGHAALIGIGGLLLLLPGFVSDILGILLFLPPVRSLILARLARRTTIVVVRSQQRGSARGIVDLDPDEWQSRGAEPGRRPAPSDPARLPGPGPDPAHRPEMPGRGPIGG